MHFDSKFIKISFDAIVFNIGNFIYLGSQWLISVVLVRFGGFEDAGVFSLAMAICNVLVVVSNYNLRVFYVSDVKSKFSDNTYIATRICTMMFAIAVCIAFTVFKGYAFRTQMVVWMYMFYKSVESYSDVLTGIWQKKEGMKNVALSLGLKGLLSVLFFGVSYGIFHDLLISTILMSFASVLVLITFDFNKTKIYVNPKKLFKNINTYCICSLLKQGFHAMVAALCVIMFTSIPKLVLEDVLNAELLGVFSSVSTPSVVISTFAIGVLLPLASKMVENYESNNIKELIKLILGCNLGFVGIGLLATLFSAIAGQFMFAVVFGKEILPYFTLFYCMIWVSVFIAVINCYATFLIAIRKLKGLLFFSAIACVVEFALCMLLISKENIYGAGYAMLVTLIIQFVAETVYIIYLFNERKKDAE